MSDRLTHLSLFSGIGGIDMAAEWAGFETVGQCEFADYPTRVLEKHWPDVPRWRDVHAAIVSVLISTLGIAQTSMVIITVIAWNTAIAVKTGRDGDE